VTTTMTGRLARIPEYVLVDEMDQARRMAEASDRIHDRIAYELGFERVRVNHVASGDRLVYTERGLRSTRLVNKVEHRHDEVSSWFVVSVSDDENGNYDITCEDGEFVSRRLENTDAF